MCFATVGHHLEKPSGAQFAVLKSLTMAYRAALEIYGNKSLDTEIVNRQFPSMSDPLTEQDHRFALASFPDRLYHERLYVLFQSSYTIATLFCHSLKFGHKHYSLVDECRIKVRTSHLAKFCNIILVENIHKQSTNA